MIKNQLKSLRRPLLCAVAASVVAMTSTSQAMELEEIFVTAQKREQSLQDVGIAVITLSGEDIDLMNVTNSSQLAELTPNMTISSDRPNQSFPSIRGIGSAIRAPGVDQGVAIYLDGVQVDSGGANLFSVIDLAQVEVLKGPQGTLYGRNAIGGVINMRSTKPSEELQGNVKVGFGSDGFFEVAGGVEGALVEDVLTGRISAVYKENDDYTENLFPGIDGYGSQENTNVRATLSYTPNERFQADLTLDHSEIEGDSTPWQSVAADSGLIGAVSNGQSVAFVLSGAPVSVPTYTEDNDIRTVNHNFDSVTSSEINGAALTLKYQLNDSIDLVSITGSRESTYISTEDLDASPNSYLDVVSNNDFESFTQEFQLQYASDNVNGVFGLFYADSELDNTFSVDAFREFNVLGGSKPTTTNRISNSESFAVFTQWDWNVTDKLMLTAGLRYGESEKSNALTETTFTDIPFAAQLAGLSQCFVAAPGVHPADQPACLTAFVPASVGSNSGSAEFDRVSPKVGLTYQATDDVMVYGSITEGYRDGGLSGDVNSFARFEEEVLTSYEVGVKSELAGGSVRLNASVFYYDYEDLQLELSDILASGAIVMNVLNAGEATLSGAEIELLWAATDNFTLGINLGLLDTEYETVALRAGVNTGFLKDGNEFPAAPSTQISIVPQYAFEAFGGEINWRTEINYSDESFEDFENGGFAGSDAGSLTGVGIVNNGFAFNPSLVVRPSDLVDTEIKESTTLVNTSLTYNNDAYQLSLWVRNLLDEDVIDQRRYISGVVQNQIRYGNPRTFGVSAKLRF
ncbi:MAG: iron complex outermembrane receptor protein [Saprospiraceae bacterium]|jgi:iron complex outermembrane receptor protein